MKRTLEIWVEADTTLSEEEFIMIGSAIEKYAVKAVLEMDDDANVYERDFHVGYVE